MHVHQDVSTDTVKDFHTAVMQFPASRQYRSVCGCACSAVISWLAILLSTCTHDIQSDAAQAVRRTISPDPFGLSALIADSAAPRVAAQAPVQPEGVQEQASPFLDSLQGCCLGSVLPPEL